MNVVTGEFKDLSSCFLLNVNYTGTLAVLAGHKACGLVQLDSTSPYVIAKRSGKGAYTHSRQVQDVKFQKGHDHNVFAEAAAILQVGVGRSARITPSRSRNRRPDLDSIRLRRNR